MVSCEYAKQFILVLLLVIILQLNLFLPTLVYMYSQCSTYIAINTNIAVYKKRENAFIIILLKILQPCLLCIFIMDVAHPSIVSPPLQKVRKKEKLTLSLPSPPFKTLGLNAHHDLMLKYLSGLGKYIMLIYGRKLSSG